MYTHLPIPVCREREADTCCAVLWHGSVLSVRVKCVESFSLDLGIKCSDIGNPLPGT